MKLSVVTLCVAALALVLLAAACDTDPFGNPLYGNLSCPKNETWWVCNMDPTVFGEQGVTKGDFGTCAVLLCAQNDESYATERAWEAGVDFHDTRLRCVNTAYNSLLAVGSSDAEKAASAKLTAITGGYCVDKKKGSYSDGGADGGPCALLEGACTSLPCCASDVIGAGLATMAALVCDMADESDIACRFDRGQPCTEGVQCAGLDTSCWLPPGTPMGAVGECCTDLDGGCNPLDAKHINNGCCPETTCAIDAIGGGLCPGPTCVWTCQ